VQGHLLVVANKVAKQLNINGKDVGRRFDCSVGGLTAVLLCGCVCGMVCGVVWCVQTAFVL
jgi:hypothetical protein